MVVIFFRYFLYLSKHSDPRYIDKAMAAAESRQCLDLHAQSKVHLDRAKKKEEEETEMRRQQERERVAFRQKQMEEQVSRAKNMF